MGSIILLQKTINLLKLVYHPVSCTLHLYSLLHFVKLGGWQLSGVVISWVEIFQMEVIQSGNFPGWTHSGQVLSECELS